jgi:hypothetical protein
LAEAMSGAELATTARRDRLGTGLRALRAEFKAEIAAVRAELKAGIAAVRAEMELLRRDLTTRLGGMIVVAVGVIPAAIRYLPPHP